MREKYTSQVYEFPEDDESDRKKKIHLQLWDTAGQERYSLIIVPIIMFFKCFCKKYKIYFFLIFSELEILQMYPKLIFFKHVKSLITFSYLLISIAS